MPHRLCQAGEVSGRAAVIDRVDVAPPLRQARKPLTAVAGLVGDVVHSPAESVDIKHGVTLLSRQDAHGRVERASRGGGRCIGCAIFRPGGVRMPAVAREAARGALHNTEQSEPRDFELAEVNALGQRIVRLQGARQPLGQALNDRDLEAQAAVGDLPGKTGALLQQRRHARAQVVKAGAQLRRGRGFFQVFDASAMGRQQGERDIDAIEVAIVFAAVLQMIDDLQSRAQRVVGGPGRVLLAMHVEHEAADRHGRVAAIVHQLVPVAVAQLGDVEAEGGQQIPGVLGIERPLRQYRAQRDAFRLGVALAEQRRFQAVEQIELFGRRQRRVIGNVIGGAYEIIERHDRFAVARLNEARGNGEVFAPMVLAAAQVGGHRHRAPRGADWTRPFQARPRAYCSANSMVQTI